MPRHAPARRHWSLAAPLIVLPFAVALLGWVIWLAVTV